MAKPTIDQLTEFHEQMKAGRVTRENFQAYLKNLSGFLGEFPSLTLAPDLIPEYTDSDGKKRKWEVVEDVAPTLKSVSDLNLIGFLNNSESYISGEKMRQRAKMLNAYLGLADAKFMLDHQADIPVKMGRYYIVFPGTLLRSPDGYLCVAFLYWSGGGWVVCFSWLVGWGGGDRLARCK